MIVKERASLLIWCTECSIDGSVSYTGHNIDGNSHTMLLKRSKEHSLAAYPIGSKQCIMGIPIDKVRWLCKSAYAKVLYYRYAHTWCFYYANPMCLWLLNSNLALKFIIWALALDFEIMWFCFCKKIYRQICDIQSTFPALIRAKYKNDGFSFTLNKRYF